MIKREAYLSIIRNFYDVDIIKVITGIKRCGKSTLLRQIIDELKAKGVDDKQIIYINFEDSKFYFIKNYLDLDGYIKDKIKNKKKYYILLDEVQIVDEWERVINSFKLTLNVSLFITSSKLLSSELAALLSGKYVSFKLAPFAFKEVVEYKNIKKRVDIEEAFNDYLLWGGMPNCFELSNSTSKETYLKDVFSSIELNIIKRNSLKNIAIFERVMKYLVTNPKQIFSTNNMINIFKKEKIPVSSKTIYECLDYAEEAFLISKISTYDLKEQRILFRKNKYYLTDLGLGQILNINKEDQYKAYLENIVFNELIFRGYSVSIGNINGKEIDFIATKYNIKEYYQVTFELSNKETEERKFGAYKSIADNYPKYVISTDKLDYSQNGIIHKNIIDWLLEK